jgi:hypothetical protein
MVTAVFHPGSAHAGRVDLDAAGKHLLHGVETEGAVLGGSLIGPVLDNVADRHDFAGRVFLVYPGVNITDIPQSHDGNV